MCSDHGGQKRTSDPLALVLEMTVSSMWVLKIEYLTFSRRAASALNG